MRYQLVQIYGAFAALIMAAGVSVTPAGAESLTRDLTIEQKRVADFALPESDLKVTAWVDRKDESYRAGDTVQLFVKANRDSYITVIDVGTSGKVHILFPNRHHTDNRVLAHQVLEIPGPDAPYRIRVGGPAGHELIKVIATTRPDQLIQADRLAESGPFQSYRGTPEGLTRDLGIELKEKYPTATEADAAAFNKVIRISTDGAALQTPAAPAPTALTGVSAEELFKLGEASFYGESGDLSYREALRLFTAAAEAGHVGAMVFIGRIHEAGMDVPANLPLAISWHRKAAELGNTQAMVRLSLIHARGDGTRRDIPEALRWLRKAAAQGDGAAMLNLAKMHDEGKGVERLPDEAARFLLSALRAGAWTAIEQADRLSTETRRQLQVELTQAGFYSGAFDGQIGPETRAAMVEFGRKG
jgi:TPR repeat protein